MLFAFPSSPASPAAEIAPPAPLLTPAPPADAASDGATPAVPPDFAGFLALADAPAAGIPAAESEPPPQAGFVAAGPAVAAPPHPAASPASAGEGSVACSARWIRTPVVSPGPSPAGAPGLAPAPASADPVAEKETAREEALPPDRPGPAGSETEREEQDAAGISADSPPAAPAQPAVPPRDPLVAPSPFPPAPPRAPSAAGLSAGDVAERDGAGGAEASSLSASGSGKGAEYPIYHYKDARAFSVSSGSREEAREAFPPVPQAPVLAAPGRGFAAPAPAPEVASADAPAIPLVAAPAVPVSVAVAASLAGAAPSSAPAIVPGSSETEIAARVPRPRGRVAEPVSPAPAVFAAPVAPSVSVDAGNEVNSGKNIPQVTEKEVLVEAKVDAGTEKAVTRGVMPSTAAQAFSTAAASFAVERVEVLPAPSVAETPAAVASRLVERVAAAAERVEARPAEPVWVRVDLSGDYRVEVKVAFRAGRVFADFRTDSDDLRAALAQAWDGFVRGREAAGPRWAEPVFAASGQTAAPAPAAPTAPVSAGETQTRPDADSGRQSSGRRDTPASWHEAFAPRSVSPRSAAPVVSAASDSRPDSSRHLSALA